jgi:Trp operon repressor
MLYKHEFGAEFEELVKKVAKDKNLLHEFLYDILSPYEYKDLAVRLQIVKMLNKKIPHRDIAEHLRISVATVTRGSREMMNKKGGFRLVLKKYYKNKSSS